MRKTKTIEDSELDPWKLFLNAMRSPVTRDRYSTRVAKFFDFTKIPGRTLEQKAGSFVRKGKNDTDWVVSVDNGSRRIRFCISTSTIAAYYSLVTARITIE